MSSVTDFTGKTILVTGASSGVGESCARYLDSCGASVVLVARRADKLSELASSLTSKAYSYPCDLGDIAAIPGLFSFLAQENIKLDGFVHSAGQTVNYGIGQFDYEDAVRLFNVNFFSFCEIMKYCGKKKYMNPGSGIVVVSSIASIKGSKAQGVYAASKAALEGYMRIAAKELLGKKIRVNAVLPGQIDTDMTKRFFEGFDGSEERVNRIQSLGAIEPDSLSKLMAFLVSDDGRFFTGASIPVDGGSMSYDWME